jgi:hypothetical protein
VEEAGEESKHWSLVRSLVVVRFDIADLLQSAMFMRLSAEQIPLFTQTASGGKMMATRPRKMSLPHMLKLSDVACCVIVV